MTTPGSTRHPEWPAAWRSGSRPLWLAVTALFAALTVGVVITGVLAMTRLAEGRGAFLLFGSVFLLLATVLIYLTRARGRPRGEWSVQLVHLPEVGQHAVIFPYARSVYVAYVGSMLFALLFFGFLLFGGLAIGVDDGFDGQAFVLIAIGGALTTYSAWFLTEVLRGRIRQGFVALTPSGVYHRSWAIQGFFPWRDVIGVRAVHVQVPMIEGAVAANSTARVSMTSRVWPQSERKMAPHLTVRAQWLATDPALLLAALTFYHTQPTLQPELSSEAGLQRLRQHRLD